MADKCVILCADHRCKHNLPGSYYGVCQHPDHANAGVYGGIDRMYMETCPRNEPIPPNMVRTGCMPRIVHGHAGSCKSTLETAQIFEIMTSSAEEPITFTNDDVMSVIEQFVELPSEITSSRPSEFQRVYMGKWNIGKEKTP